MLNSSCSPGHSTSEERRARQREKDRQKEEVNSQDLGQIQTIKHSAPPDLGSV